MLVGSRSEGLNKSPKVLIKEVPKLSEGVDGGWIISLRLGISNTIMGKHKGDHA